MKSHSLLRTNTGLTTNAKIIVSSDYSLYVDCIQSRPELNAVRFRKFVFKKENFIDEIIPTFFRETPVEIAYSVKYDGDNSTMYTDFSKQYDDLYLAGARNIYDNKDYKEEFEYFAPLHISKSGLPTHFVIFRVDGPGLLDLHKDNFREEILNQLKVVKVFDMTTKTDLGEFLKRNITENTNFPVTSLEIEFNKLEFSYFIGIDYETGGYTKRSQMLESTFGNEFTFMDMERFIYKGFSDNRIVYPHIINFSFLFDDTPATPSSLRKWSINRYLGFYLNKMELVLSISPNKFSPLKRGAYISRENNLEMKDGSSPFLNEDDLKPYIEIEGQVYTVQKFIVQGESRRQKVITEKGNYVDRILPTESIKYKILSDKLFYGKESLINKNVVTVKTEDGVNTIYLQDGGKFEIADFDDCDVWLIKIGEKFHKLIKDSDGYINIFTDYAFLQSDDKFEYYINESDPKYRTTINLVSSATLEPVEFEIYRCEFTDIKDFDTDIVDTEFSKFEYEEDDILTENDEPKFFLTNLNSKSQPKEYDDFIISGEVANVPVSSEYTANHETFRIVENDLNELWRKNPIRVKWGYQNSISDADYPYLLNNNFSADDFNKSINPFVVDVIRQEKNLDYFYTINPDSNKYIHQTLHIKPISGENIDVNYKFDVIQYLNSKVDYFTYFFGQKTDFLNGEIIKNTKKWSQFNPSDGITTNNTLFRGLKFKIFNVQSVNIKDGKLDKVNLKITNEFDDYKFSILLSENDGRAVLGDANLNSGVTESFYNTMNWTIIDNWKMDKTYRWNQLVLWNNQLWITTGGNSTPTRRENNPSSNPGISNASSNGAWKDLSDNYTQNPTNQSQNFILETIFWSSAKNSDIKNFNFSAFPQVHPFVWLDGDWWYDTGVPGGTRFWSYLPNGYLPNNGTYYKGKIWKANTKALVIPSPTEPNGGTWSVKTIPGNNERIVVSKLKEGKYTFEYNPHWEETNLEIQKVGRWKKIPLWSSSLEYSGTSKVGDGTGAIQSRNGQNYSTSAFNMVIYNEVLYGMTGPSTTVIKANSLPPDRNPSWVRLYSLKPDKDFNYTNTLGGNSVIFMNGRYYMCVRDSTIVPSTLPVDVVDGTLDNGITIYINKKFKNILVNIYVNDRTYDDSILNINSTTPRIFPTETSSSNLTKMGNKVRDINRDDIYSDILQKLTAHNFMNAINDLSNKYDFINAVRYVITEESGDLKVYDFDNLLSVSKLPYVLTCEGPDEFFVKRDTNIYEALETDSNLLKPRFSLKNGTIGSKEQINYVGDVPYASVIRSNRVEKQLVPNFSSLKNQIFNKMYRHSGFYSPIFKNIELFTAFTEDKNIGNFKFDTSLTEFGMTGERIISKVNKSQNILKLANVSSAKSIYPMLDEFGYHVVKTFIFKSTWDFKYHYETLIPLEENRLTSKLVQKQKITDKTTGNSLL